MALSESLTDTTDGGGSVFTRLLLERQAANHAGSLAFLREFEFPGANQACFSSTSTDERVEMLTTYALADRRVIIRRDSRQIIVDEVDLTVGGHIHAILMYLGRPDRLNTPQKFSHILNEIPAPKGASTAARRRTHALMGTVAAFRKIIRNNCPPESHDLADTATGIVRLFEPVGYFIVSSLTIPPVRKY